MSNLEFKIIIIGAGIAGLGASIGLRKKGHEVHVYEAAHELHEVGAGIQLPPNCSRILDMYGARDSVEEYAVWPGAIQFRRYSNGAHLGSTKLRYVMTERYGYPYWVIHRADYQRALYITALEAGVFIHMGMRVESVDTEAPSITIKDTEEVFKADLVIGADGIRSNARTCVIPGGEILPTAATNSVYRVRIPANMIKGDRQLSQLVSDPNMNCWIGPKREIMAYPIRKGSEYNLVLSHPSDVGDTGQWHIPADLDQMRETFKDFDPMIQRVLTYAEEGQNWRLAELANLSSWISDSGKAVLIGDAAHAMTPYLAQGAATAIEDGACLAECLTRAKSVGMIPRITRAFEKIRKQRVEYIKDSAREYGKIWELEDGPQQERRDLEMREDLTRVISAQNEENPLIWSDPAFQPWLFGYDVVEDTNKQLDQILA